MVSPEVAAIAITLAVHVLGAAILIVTMFDGEEHMDLFGGWWPKDKRDDGPSPSTPSSPAQERELPLPDAAQSARRLRGPGRIGRWTRPRRVRPAHEPRPAPSREREPS